MKVVLNDGVVALIKCTHGNERPQLNKDVPGEFRSVRLDLTVLDQEKEVGSISGTGYCVPTDQFVRFEGRKYAMRKLFAANRKNHLLSKEDCQKVANAILYPGK